MPKDEWGLKRTCPECQTRFYDLTNNPMTCPSCGVSLTPDSFSADKSRVEKTQAAPAAEKVEPEDIVDVATTEIEDDGDDIVDDTLLDDDEDDDTVSLEELSDRPASDDDDS